MVIYSVCSFYGAINAHNRLQPMTNEAGNLRTLAIFHPIRFTFNKVIFMRKFDHDNYLERRNYRPGNAVKEKS